MAFVRALLLQLTACGAPSDHAPAAEAHAWAKALATGDCEGLAADLHDACVIADVERLRADRCDDARTVRARGECRFRLAERTLDARICARAAPYVEDCALHVLSATFRSWVPAGAAPGGPEEELLAGKIVQAGLDVDDPRPWSAWYRWVLGAQRPLDRGACGKVASPQRREACVQTGRAVFEDRLNRARDEGTIGCSASDSAQDAVPELLRHTHDPELDALVAQRRARCR